MFNFVSLVYFVLNRKKLKFLPQNCTYFQFFARN